MNAALYILFLYAAAVSSFGRMHVVPTSVRLGAPRFDRRCSRYSPISYSGPSAPRATLIDHQNINQPSADDNIVSRQPIFRFGVIADIQYCDTEDAMNFQMTRLRRYRNSKEVFNRAVQTFNGNVACTVILGDIVDGKSQMQQSQYRDLDSILEIAGRSTNKLLYCFGNHCHYSFSRQELFDKVLMGRENGGMIPALRSDRLYYDYAPHPGYRFVFIDSYDISLIGASKPENKEIAAQWLAEHNPNDLTQGGTWFNNLPRYRSSERVCIVRVTI
jgi:hypothetical protein